jgi:nitrogen fixation NifU-like protein
MTQAHPLTVQELESHFDDPFQRGNCEIVTHAAEFAVESNGCALRVEAAVDDEGNLLDLWWDGDGCAWCEGQMSLVTEKVRAAIESGTRMTTAAALSSAMEVGHAVFALLNQTRAEDTTIVCYELPLKTLRLCFDSPVAEAEDDLADGSKFGGPSLREEC